MYLLRSMLYPTTEYTKVSMYPGMRVGIDLRRELDSILLAYGHWVKVRKYDTTVHSKYWNDETHEAVGGPAWEYTDYIVRARKEIQRSGGVLSALEMPTPMGVLTIPYVIYYLKWDAAEAISNEDEIYEFDWDEDRTPGIDDDIDMHRKYNILESVDLLGDTGRREYYLCICRLDRIGW